MSWFYPLTLISCYLHMPFKHDVSTISRAGKDLHKSYTLRVQAAAECLLELAIKWNKLKVITDQKKW